MIVGVDTDFLRGPMTGMANYGLQSLHALLALQSDLDLHRFERFAWSRLSCDDLLATARASGKTLEPSRSCAHLGATAPRREYVPARLMEVLRSSSPARRIYRSCRGAAFARSAMLGKLDLFHAVASLPPANVAVPVLPVVCDLSYVRLPAAHPPDRVRHLERIASVIERAPRVQTISRFTANEIAEIFGYPIEKIVVAPPAAGAVFRPLGRPETERELLSLGLGFGSYFLSVGTLEPRKNMSTLIHAYARLRPAARLRFPLVIAGGRGWGDLALPGATDRLVAEGSVRFLGFVADDELRALYEGARLTLYPSIYEGFGMPVLEAMACGAPVVHATGTGANEISEVRGQQISALDVAAWTLALERSLDSDEALTAASRAARTRRAGDFRWSRTAEAILQTYRDVAAA